MPTYEYECLSCGHHFEIFQMMTDERVKTCPKCKKPVRRLIGAGSGIIFKGAGFYATDYRKPNKASQAVTDKTACQQDNKPQDKKSQDKTPQGKKPEDKKSYKKETPGAKDSKSL